MPAPSPDMGVPPRLATCPTCSGTALEPLFEAERFPVAIRAVPADVLADAERTGLARFHLRVDVCATCGSVILNPPPTPAQLAFLYAHYTYPSPIKLAQDRRAFASEALEKFAELMAPHVPETPSDVLEIGCSEGAWLLELQRLGHRVVGCEPGPLGRYGRDVLGLDIRPVTFDAAQFPDARFDVVVHRHLIEHVPDGHAFLREIRRILRPGGLMLVETPDAAAWLASGRMTAILPEHLVLYGRTALEQLLASEGFSLVARVDAMEQYVVARLGDPVPPPSAADPHPLVDVARAWLNDVQTRAAEVRALLAGFPENARIACFGASAHAVLSSRYVADPRLARAILVDDNPDAWGQRLTGFDEPIRPPEALRDGPPPDLVIAQSFAATDSILDGLRRLGLAGVPVLSFYPRPALRTR